MTDFVSIQTRGTISLPPALRRRYGLDEPGAQMEIIDAGDHIVLRPKLAVDSSQSWFWNKDWQAGEIEAEAQRRGGEGTVHESGAELLDALESEG
ncbi:AbrB/MazE/SpoVT family DNA-binding domain-containing protein [Pontimonas sp.]|nr:AbrB/MazE/SpoVT family DNA-binding domain-containing protein [Pontimonas sp.]